MSAAVPLSGAMPSMVTVSPVSETFPDSSRLNAFNKTTTASFQFLGAPEASSSLSSRVGRSNHCRDKSRRRLRMRSFGTLPANASVSGLRLATNTKGSTLGGRTLLLMTLSPGGQRVAERLLQLGEILRITGLALDA